MLATCNNGKSLRHYRWQQTKWSYSVNLIPSFPQFFLELITTQLRFYMVSPQLSLLNLIYVILSNFATVIKFAEVTRTSRLAYQCSSN